MSNVVNLSCACGTVRGKLNVVNGSFFHIHCLCCDCQSFASYLNNEERILDESGGTMNSSKIPFVGVSVKLIQFDNEREKLEILGPVAMKAFGKYAIGEKPTDAHPKFPISYVPKIMGFMLKGIFGKKNRPSPFYRDGEPVAKAKIL